MPHPALLARLLIPALLLAPTIMSCARNPVTGKSEIALVSESQEIQMGKEASQQTIQSIGLVNDPSLQAYVSAIGMKMAAASERPHLPWEFHVADDASVNAFALPGGFIFATRGLLTYMNNEAELATVIGHEIGHVTNRHSVQQISKSQITTLGLGIGSVFSSDFARYSGLASQGLQVLFLKYSRDAESQADLAGFRYALGQNYDVREMASVFHTLDRVGGGGGGKLPEWLATHPAPANRVAATESRLDTLHRDMASTVIKRDEYLQHIAGLTFGEDPRQGFFQGSQFYHPDLRFQLTFPEGWQTQNAADAVVAGSPNQDAIMRLTLAGKASPRDAVATFLSREGVRAGNGSTASINGLPAASSYFEKLTDQGAVAGLVTFIGYGGNTYGLLSYTEAGKLGGYDAAFRRTAGSFEELRNGAALSVQPAKVELVKLSEEMTLAEFNARHPSSIPIGQLAIINEVDRPDSAIPAGRTVKQVRGGVLREGAR